MQTLKGNPNGQTAALGDPTSTSNSVKADFTLLDLDVLPKGGRPGVTSIFDPMTQAIAGLRLWSPKTETFATSMMNVMKTLIDGEAFNASGGPRRLISDGGTDRSPAMINRLQGLGVEWICKAVGPRAVPPGIEEFIRKLAQQVCPKRDEAAVWSPADLEVAIEKMVADHNTALLRRTNTLAMPVDHSELQNQRHASHNREDGST